MYRKIKEWPRQIRQGVRSLIQWFPIIWKDRQWDHFYIYVVLRHKLHLTEQLIRHHGHHVKHIEDADKIKKCVLILDRLIEDDYHENVYRNHDKKWGDGKMIFTDSTEHPGYSIMDIKYPNVKTKEDDKLQDKEYRRLMMKPEELRKQDIEMLFKLMTKHIQTWWD